MIATYGSASSLLVALVIRLQYGLGWVVLLSAIQVLTGLYRFNGYPVKKVGQIIARDMGSN